MPRQNVMADQSNYLVRFSAERKDNSRALICIPQGGSGANAFRSWGKTLRDVATVWAVCLPGREHRLAETPLSSIEAMAESLVSPVLDLPAADLTLFGHCSGALIAYELAHRLAADSDRGGQPRRVRLVVSSQLSPMASSVAVAAAAAAAAATAGPQATGGYSIPELVHRLRELGGTPPEVLDSAEFMELLAPMIRADFQASDGYRWPDGREPLDLPVVALGGESDSLITRTGLVGWRDVTTGRFDIHLFEAGHFYLYEQEELVLGYLRELCLQPA
jgi:medium-chain acyl-[acyl-carrier-protein] hydrolase